MAKLAQHSPNPPAFDRRAMFELTPAIKQTTITVWSEWLTAGRPHVFWGRHPKLRSMRAYILGIKSRHICSLITAAARRRYGGRISGMDRRKRESLHDAIFEVMNHFESMNGGQPDDPRVVELSIALNLVADDLAWNDEGGER